MSERVDGDDTVHESNVLDFLPGSDDSFVMRERRESRKTSVCRLLASHRDFEFNIAVMSQDREGNQNYIRNLLSVSQTSQLISFCSAGKYGFQSQCR